MDFAEMFRVLRRRWLIAVPGLLLTIVAAVGAYVAWPTTWQSTAEISLLGSKSAAEMPGNGGNVYMASGNLVSLSGVLIANLSSAQAVQALAAQGATATYTVQIPQFAAGPFVLFTVTSKSKAEINATMPKLISYAQSQLKNLQEDAYIKTPADGLVYATVIAPESVPTKVLKKKIELVAGLAVLGLLATLLLSFAVEARARNRSREEARALRRETGRSRESGLPVSPATEYAPRRRDSEPERTGAQPPRWG